MTFTIYKDYATKLNPKCYTTGREGQAVRVLVCHNTCGKFDINGQGAAKGQALSDIAAAYLCSNDREVSAHYLVGAEDCGAPIYSIVKEWDTAYHCGGSPPAFPSSWKDPVSGQITGKYDLNLISIGIEVFGQASDKIGPNQLTALKGLVMALAAKYPILKKEGHIVAHASLEGDRQDGLNWVAFARAWALLQGTPTPTPPVPYDPNPKHFNVGPGMLAALKANGLVSATNEQFGDFGAAGKRSMLYTTVPGLLLIAFIQADGSAEVKRFRQLD